MCGIFAICHSKCEEGVKHFDIEIAKELSYRQSHRGPDKRNSYQHPGTGDLLCHERLSIVDLGISQPLQGTLPDHQVIHNGEIYNHAQLRAQDLKSAEMKTHCDSEVIIFLYEKIRSGQICNALDGVFAFALIHGTDFLVARDPIGVKPLYYGVDKVGRYYFSNEMKTMEHICGPVELAVFPPGHFWQPNCGFVRFYEPLWFDHRLAVKPSNTRLIHDTLVKAVHKRLMSDAPIGVLLSGGLDSSLVSSIACRELQNRGIELHSFAVAMSDDAPDMIASRIVANHIGSIHHEIYFTPKEGIENLINIIFHLETYDITTIRASTPMFIMSYYITKYGIKVVLSGEGADEIFGGYLYFHNAPSDEEFQKETVERVRNLSTADCLRADKSTMSHSLEVRVPFLDKEFLDVAMLTEPQSKRPQPYNGRKVEKHLLRAAFDTQREPYLPHEILWRQKEQFSDGVGYSWIDELMKYCADQVTDEEFAKAEQLYTINTPHSKEAFYMRKLFHELFPSDNAAKTVKKWIPKWQENTDPSGRAALVHVNSYQRDINGNEKLTNDVKRENGKVDTNGFCIKNGRTMQTTGTPKFE